MNGIVRALTRIGSREDGQALAEYALILAFVFAVCVIAVTALGLAIAGGFGGIMGGF
jgi:Flp pilus assembly pilin Flp